MSRDNEQIRETLTKYFFQNKEKTDLAERIETVEKTLFVVLKELQKKETEGKTYDFLDSFKSALLRQHTALLSSLSTKHFTEVKEDDLKDVCEWIGCENRDKIKKVSQFYSEIFSNAVKEMRWNSAPIRDGRSKFYSRARPVEPVDRKEEREKDKREEWQRKKQQQKESQKESLKRYREQKRLQAKEEERTEQLELASITPANVSKKHEEPKELSVSFKTASGSAINSNKQTNKQQEQPEEFKGIEPRIIELIRNEIIVPRCEVQWDDIAGVEHAKKTIQEAVIWPMLRPDIFTGLRGPPKGILLFGPPGTGKTMLGRCIASQAKATFFCISASSLTSKWVGEGEKMVRALFTVAKSMQPAVVFVDEIDSLLSQRTDGEFEATRRIKTEFLVQLDGAGTDRDDRILIVGATNRPHEIDEAARRRLVKRLYIPLPDTAARLAIIKKLTVKITNDLSSEEIEKICQKTDGYSGSDMDALCREAALGPIRTIKDIMNVSSDSVRPVNISDFSQALTQVRASVSKKDLDFYVEWNKSFGCVV